MKVAVSIIIVNWNTKELLMQCIKSLTQNSKLKTQNQNLNLKSEYEIIIVDNGSTDGSKEYLKTQISNVKSKTQNSKLKIILNEANLGFSKAVNQGLRQAQGEVVLLLNSDTQVKPGALEKLLEFEKQVGPAIIGAKMLDPDGTVQGSCFYFPTIKRAILEYWLGKKNYFSKYAPLGKEPVEVDAISGGAMLISRAVIDKVGLLDERYFMYFEDLEYCRRAGKYAFKVFYLPGAEIVHEHGASGQNSSLPENQWRRLIPSSKIYYGQIKHYLISFILWSGQKWAKIKRH